MLHAVSLGSNLEQRLSFHKKVNCRMTSEHTARSEFSSERLGTLIDSGSFARVAMMQSTDFWNLNHRIERGRGFGTFDLMGA